ncbi:hypothetical protein GLX30_11575 [Streptomyces sp. Tu 2975]|uniref:DUF6193 family natural product biosynthesis protein n=1 Tax=Streptomyces sp. Tu 2975 TaxID=2676871 RepID=UPI00135717E2|nr:DUF6193 family natural product biosynthesis protein [Streptomyces sp. Tu 2975]QIP84561.1 hypothetical protein GLX30_11575 [Streptomyces sp. Tu 2975]
MSAIDSGLYPDVSAMGGLTDAIVSIARRRGIDVGAVVDPASSPAGESVTAELESGRGTMHVSLGTESRTFFLGIYERRFVWAEGATDDLESLVDAVAAWRGGMLVGDFAGRFPFMVPGRLARAREEGDVTRAQWDRLCTAEVYADERSLVTAFHEDGRFHRLFPNLSHGVLRLSFGDGVQGARELHVVPMGGGPYRVIDTQQVESAEVVASLDEAVAVAARCLPGS